MSTDSKREPKFKELTTEQKRWAHEQVAKFKMLRVAIPYGLIIKEAKNKFKQ